MAGTMPWYLQAEVWNVALALVATLLSIYAIVEGKRTARRSGFIELHGAWDGVNELNAEHLIGPDVAAATRALSVTAIAWNHGLIDKRILHQSYWADYQQLYGVLAASNEDVPGYRRAGREFLNEGMRNAYREMESWERAHSAARRRLPRKPLDGG